MWKLSSIMWLLLHISMSVAATAVSVEEGLSDNDQESTPEERRLWIAAAESARVDTSQRFVQAWNRYCRDSLASLNPPQVCSSNLCVVKRMDHLLFPLPQYASSWLLGEAEARMDSLYGCLMEGQRMDPALLRCRKVVRDTLYCYPNRMIESFDKAVEGLEVGQWSHPFYTPVGMHLVRPLHEVTLEETSSPSVGFRLLSENQLSNRLVLMGYRADDSKVEKLLNGRPVEGILFTMGSQTYTYEDFNRFAASQPWGRRKLFAAFVQKSLFDAEARQMLHRLDGTEGNPLREQLLISCYQEQYLAPYLADTIALQQWFTTGEGRDYFDNPRFEGLVICCADKRQSRQLRKFLKKLPEEERLQALRMVSGTDGFPLPVYQAGCFAQGDHPAVDEAFFNGPKLPRTAPYPYTILFGRKVKGVPPLSEVRQQAVSAYRQYLLRQHLAQLRMAFEVGK